MRAYLIDTPNKQIVEVDWDGDYKSIKQLIKVDIYTPVYITEHPNPDCVFVDDEGLINGNPHGWFTFDTYNQPLRGYGLVLGTDHEGASVEPQSTLAQLQARVTFYDDGDLKAPEEYVDVQIYTGDDALRRMGLL